ncbi:MAG: transglutaminase domain-containing protein [Phycisphaeraceae bacterium]|nr:transglutaminase domain-containing protein [Phycisphaeraceae bacterium]MCB9846929.1 transglutaminase domain-containing protein [Phycisphaeraceae bacterium]
MNHRFFRSLLLPALALCVLLAPRALAGTTIEDRWYVVEITGQRTGWMHAQVERDDDGNVATSTELNLKISRGAITIPIEMAGVFVETPEGEPVRMASTQRLGQMPIDSSWVFTEGKRGQVRASSSQFGATNEQTLNPPAGQWMTPYAATRYVEEQIESGAKSIVTNTVDPAVGLNIVTTTATIKGETTIEALGRVVPAVEWEAVTSAAPGVRSVEYVNLEGEPIRTEVNFGGISMTIVLADKELALSRLDPAEIMVSTFVRPSAPINNPRKTWLAEYRLTLDGGGEFEVADTGSQTWSRDGDAITLRVCADTGLFHEEHLDDVSPYLASTSTADLHDPEIVALVVKALRGAENKSDAEKAETLRRFVHSYISEKSLAVGFATASEVCRTRQGDCSEHGVLLAAMLRAAGVPSRVASGLIYADAFAGQRQIFGYHMWSQALLTIDGSPRWVDLDATLDDSTPFDATHIAIAVSDLADGEAINSMAALAPVLGRLQIEVVMTE